MPPQQVTLIDPGNAKHKSELIFFMDFLEIILSRLTSWVNKSQVLQWIAMSIDRAYDIGITQLQFPQFIKFAKWIIKQITN